MENAKICSVPESYTVRFGDINVPSWINVYCKDADLYWDIYGKCMDVCDLIQSDASRFNTDDDDDSVVCLHYNRDDDVMEGVPLLVI